MNAKAWFYGTSFHGNLSHMPQPEPAATQDVEELEEKTAPSSSSGFMDRSKHQFVRFFFD